MEADNQVCLVFVFFLFNKPVFCVSFISKTSIQDVMEVKQKAKEEEF